MDLKPELMAELKKFKCPIKCEIKFRIPQKYKESELDGLDWGAGYVVKRMKYVQNLGKDSYRYGRDSFLCNIRLNPNTSEVIFSHNFKKTS